MPQLEGPTTKIYNYVLEGFGEKKAKKKKERKTAGSLSITHCFSDNNFSPEKSNQTINYLLSIYYVTGTLMPN